MVIDQLGEVGIGTTDPETNLTIFSDEDNKGLDLQTADNTFNQGIRFRNSGAHYTWRIYRKDAGNDHADGIIFYLDASGHHGLVCASTDQSPGIGWDNGSHVDTYAYGNGIGAGEGNSQGIRRWQGSCSSCYASELCRDLTLGGYSDWCLPSKYELNLMYENVGLGGALGLGNVGGFASSRYWSSTEFGHDYTWNQLFSTGIQSYSVKDSPFRVRAVRAF